MALLFRGNRYSLCAETVIIPSFQSELGAVAPGEELACELGAESGIEVIYRPMFKSKENATGQKATVSFKQVIDVRNTFQRPVRVMVVDQLPSSGEDKIKVSFLVH